jgi:hypothetical protein
MIAPSRTCSSRKTRVKKIASNEALEEDEKTKPPAEKEDERGRAEF